MAAFTARHTKLRYDIDMKPVAAMLFAMLLPPLLATAEIYKWVDDEGNIVYSDTPNNRAEEYQPPGLNAIQMPKPAPKTEPEKKPEAPGYQSFRIVSPKPEQVVRDNSGNLTIQLASKPPLQDGHYYSVLVDGYVMVKKTTDNTVTLPGISPGEHKIRALIRNANGKTLAKTGNVIVHMKRQGTISGVNQQVGPRDSQGKPIRPGPVGVNFKPGPVGVRFQPGPAVPASP